LKNNGYIIADTIHLNHYGQLPDVLNILETNSNAWDLALVGASVPGRILCVNIAQKQNKTALEVGHMMDAFADPAGWTKHHNRRYFTRFRPCSLARYNASSALEQSKSRVSVSLRKTSG